jgi:hypothetical protein
VNGVDSDNNHFELNNYNNDVSRQMVDVGPAAPYTVGGRRRRKGVRRTRSRKGGSNQSKVSVGVCRSTYVLKLGIQKIFSDVSVCETNRGI